MYTNNKLKERLHDEWEHFMEGVMEGNRDVSERFYNETLAFDFDSEQDRLTMWIGGQRRPTYTQGVNHIYFDLGVDDDRIDAITIRDVTEYMHEKGSDPIWVALLKLLREVRRIEVPPVHAGAERAAFALQITRLFLSPA